MSTPNLLDMDPSVIMDQFRTILEDESLDTNDKIDKVKQAFTEIPAVDLGGMPIRVQDIELHIHGMKMGTLEELLPGFLVTVLGDG